MLKVACTTIDTTLEKDQVQLTDLHACLSTCLWTALLLMLVIRLPERHAGYTAWLMCLGKHPKVYKGTAVLPYTWVDQLMWQYAVMRSPTRYYKQLCNRGGVESICS